MTLMESYKRNKIRNKTKEESKVKAIPLQSWTGPECSRRSEIPDFKTVDT